MWVEEGSTEHELDYMASNWCSNEYLLYIYMNIYYIYNVIYILYIYKSFDVGNWEIYLQLRIAHTEHDFK